jgi:hypothetical protein
VFGHGGGRADALPVVLPLLLLAPGTTTIATCTASRSCSESVCVVRRASTAAAAWAHAGFAGWECLSLAPPSATRATTKSGECVLAWSTSPGTLVSLAASRFAPGPRRDLPPSTRPRASQSAAGRP